MSESSKQTYQVLFTKTARKDYEEIRDQKLKRGINRIIEKIKEDPYQFKKLSGPLSHLWSAKTFSFRLLYAIGTEPFVVHVVAIEHRREVYRGN